jgi:ABC-type branched-subunit amino acid transport system ATPase component
MLALARALMASPDVLLLDEPSAGLAPMAVDLIFEKVREINASGVTILMVEQNARRALSISDRGYVLETGRNRFEGSGAALLANPQVVDLYLGGTVGVDADRSNGS